MLELGKKMGDIRKHNKITLEDLSRQTGYSVSTICRYEKNSHMPSLEYMVQFSKICNVSIDNMLGLHFNKVKTNDMLSDI